MSVAVISYRSLDNASDEAKAVAKKLSEYADGLQSAVYRKLSGYSGDHTANIRIAEEQTGLKIDTLREKANAYDRYAADLSDLRDRCENTDRAVRTKISQLTASFKSAHDIGSNAVSDALNYFLTSVKNSGSAGRWISDRAEEGKSIQDYIRQDLEDWWDYEGGEALVKGTLTSLFDIVAGVCDLCFAVATLAAAGTFAAAVLAAMAVIGAVIRVVNSAVGGINELRAYGETKNGDPATGRRRSDEDSLSDTLKKETDSKFLHDFASGMDIAELVCQVTSLAGNAGNVIKNTYKWTTGSMSRLEDLRVIDILKKGNVTEMMNKIGKTLSDNVRQALKLLSEGQYSQISRNLSSFTDDLMRNLKNSYTNFDSLTEGASSVKNLTSAAKYLTESESPKDILSGLTRILAGNTGIGQATTYDGTNRGAAFYSDKKIYATDITNLIEKGKQILGNDLFRNDAGDKDLRRRLTAIPGI